MRVHLFCSTFAAIQHAGSSATADTCFTCLWHSWWQEGHSVYKYACGNSRCSGLEHAEEASLCHNWLNPALPGKRPLKWRWEWVTSVIDLSKGLFDYRIRIRIHNESEPKVNPAHTRHAQVIRFANWIWTEIHCESWCRSNNGIAPKWHVADVACDAVDRICGLRSRWITYILV